MTPQRATVYVGLATVLVAWLARAGGVSVSENRLPQAPSLPVVDTTGTQSLADELHQQTARLRDRLSLSPEPSFPARNPFAFVPRAQSRPSPRPSPALAPVAMPVAEPPIRLIGVAERQTAAGSVRTAMITADSDELFMLVEGDTLGGRYRVKAIGAEVVELTDLVTGALRRLALQ